MMINCMRPRWVCVKCGWGKELMLPYKLLCFGFCSCCFCFRRQGYTLANVLWSNDTWKFAIHNPFCISTLSQTFKCDLFITNYKEEKMKFNVQLATIVRNWMFFWEHIFLLLNKKVNILEGYTLMTQKLITWQPSS